jgi:hypothetical protein
MSDGRILCWFSCGAPSAVASKICLEEFGKDRVLVVNCDTKPSEHPDNYRFFNEVQEWLGVKVVELRNEKFADVDATFKTYMAGIRGAVCTTELKKIPRLKFAQPDDVNVFGFTVGEKKRVREFEQRNPDMLLKWPLVEQNITRAECVRRINAAGIVQPEMYRLGFDNNNCPGCVKASSPWYWDMVRTHFPEVFKRRCEQSRAIGCRLVEIHHHERIFLDELPAGPFKHRAKKEHMSCGPECGIQTKFNL